MDQLLFLQWLVLQNHPFYGVTLQFKTIYVSCLASGIGGAVIGFGGVKQYVYGTNGIFGWLQVINPQTGFDSSVLAAIIALCCKFYSSNHSDDDSRKRFYSVKSK